MKQLFSFQRKRWGRCLFVLIPMFIMCLSSLFGKLQTIQAAVSKGDLSGDVSSVSTILQYDYQKGRDSKDNQGIDKEYSLKFSTMKAEPIITGKQSTYKGDDEERYGNGMALFTKDNTKGKVTAYYRDVATYTTFEGNKIKEKIALDYKLTVLDWETNKESSETNSADPYITFRKTEGTNIGIGTRNLNWVRIKAEFFKAGTSEKVTVKGLITEYDIDDCQFVGIAKDEVERLYMNKKDTNLTYGTPDVGKIFLTFYNKTQGNAPDSEKYRNMFSFTFTGSEYEQIFGSTEAPTGVDWFYTTGSKYIFTEIPPEPPTKVIYDDDESNVTTNHVSSRLDAWTYYINQEVPLENVSQNYWDSFQFEDEIEACLNIEDIKVVNDKDEDVSSDFTITKNGQHVTAKANNIKSSSFYGHDYSLRIRVRVKKEAVKNFEAHGHYNNAKTQLIFKNTGETKITAGTDSYDKSTNEVSTIVSLPTTESGDPGLNITKNVDHYEWQVKDRVKYKVEVSHSNQDAIATDVVVTDTSLPVGLKVSPESVKVTGVDDYDFKVVEGGWVLETDTLKKGQKIQIEFDAIGDATVNGTEVVNVARVSAFAVPEKSDDAKVYFNSPKINLSKKTNKKEYKLGDTVTYHLEITQENEGCFMRDVIIKDSIETKGVDLREGSISISNQDGKDITKDCDVTTKENDFTIETHRSLVNGKNPYNIEKETKFVVTYDAEIVDEDLSGFEIVNIAKVPATKNTNGDVIRDDDEVPSGGDETKASVLVKGAELEIKKDSNQSNYEYGAIGKYTVTTKQIREDYMAKQVVLSDEIKEEGCKLDTASIRVFYNTKDITEQCEITADERTYEIQTKQNLAFGELLMVTYDVKMPEEEVTSVHNVAKVVAENAMEKEMNHVVSLEPKEEVTTSAEDSTTEDTTTAKAPKKTIKKTTKKTTTPTKKTSKKNPTPKAGDTAKVAEVLGICILSFLGLVLVLRKKIRYN